MATKTIFGYKVVSKSMESPFMGEDAKRFYNRSCIYKPYKITRPRVKGTRLFAFNDIRAAIEFHTWYGGFIYTAVLYNPIERQGLSLFVENIEELKEYFAPSFDEHSLFAIKYLNIFWFKAILCTSIKILEPIQHETNS